MKKVTILGCGWLGFAVAKVLKSDYHVIPTWRSQTTKAKLEEVGFTPLHVNLLDSLPEALFETDVLCLFISPSSNKDVSYTKLFNELLTHPKFPHLNHVIFTSSTSVYERTIETKDETYPVKKDTPLIHVEQALHVNANVCILRLAGLMGEGRYLAKYYPAQRTLANALTTVNHLHQVDAAGLIKAVIDQHLIGIYNACAPLHPTKQSILETQCEALHVKPPLFEPTTNDHGTIDASKLTNKTGYQFVYPDPLKFPL